ncbi:uncharacterized protein SPPG_06474 [Spizellomyces punctatus DAOM BR117]|uniref:RING-type E3 ubiquitin transferase n=1 Tax=Spizellomyces punctatus (strain DAOM BR117) TaxID=645134 RepID=A0A0L0H977_SPIPD|nr:uncharacterized protein SPPG_06474 [Spizellomyces punctatus DAOM BR117]KNC98060.1 hypothetical protein SPPG_06474 [Spizellomyces punctatus DAOM BR117]|eukprot:XP_016606100.1 hypothetical protein SPPG_06474 [Spizellomyces punctatus DAOM BR117]
MTTPCRFYALGTCHRRDCSFLHDRQSMDKAVCAYYQKGQCRFGNYCALQHVKAGSGSVTSKSHSSQTSQASTSRPSPVESSPTTGSSRKPATVPSAGNRRTFIPSSAALGLGAASIVVRGGETLVESRESVAGEKKPHGEEIPLETSLCGLSLSAGRKGDVRQEQPSAGGFGVEADAVSGFRSSQPWPSDYPQEQSEDDDDAEESKLPMRPSYSNIAKVGVPAMGSSVPSANPDDSVVKVDDTPLCPFAMQGICRFGDEKCRYRHGLTCPVCLKQCLDPDGSAEEHEAHMILCHSRMEQKERVNEDIDCVVCMESVQTKSDSRYGLLNCDHCVCLSCIRQWRSNQGMDTSKSCPICRTITHFVTPSSVWPRTLDEKMAIIEEYKLKLSTIDCKHFDFGQGTCPFGTSCFYRHVGHDGVAEEIKLRKVIGQEDDLRIVNTPKLADFLELYENRR